MKEVAPAGLGKPNTVSHTKVPLLNSCPPDTKGFWLSRLCFAKAAACSAALSMAILAMFCSSSFLRLASSADASEFISVSSWTSLRSSWLRRVTGGAGGTTEGLVETGGLALSFSLFSSSFFPSFSSSARDIYWEECRQHSEAAERDDPTESAPRKHYTA